MYARGLFGLVLTIAIAIGIGAIGYNAGLAQGLADSGRAVVPFYGAPFGFGFGFLGLLFPLLFLFLFFGLARALFWRGPWKGGAGYGPHQWGDRERMLEDWHRRAHGEAPAADRSSSPGERS